MRLYIRLYAIGTILLAESAKELQAALNAMFLYCKTWNLSVNPQKTKVIVVEKSTYKNNYVCMYNGNSLDVVANFSYLGMAFDF